MPVKQVAVGSIPAAFKLLLLRLNFERKNTCVKVSQFRKNLKLSPFTRCLISKSLQIFRAFPSHAIVSISLKEDFIEFQKEEPSEEHFNLNPIEMYEARHGKRDDKTATIDEAMGDSQVVHVLERSKQFLSKWTEIFTKRLVTISLP